MKKKTFITLAAVCMAMAANATILRVSNVTGSSAPYSDLQVALDAAVDGDTIMLDGSKDQYGGSNANYYVGKKIVLLGPGYWLNDNGIVQEAANHARISKIFLDAEGIVLKGLDIWRIYVRAPKTVINRCIVTEISLQEWNDVPERVNTDNTIISQNFIYESLYCGKGSYTQVTNNIFQSNNGNNRHELKDSYIAYNTFRIGEVPLMYVYNSTIEHNVWNRLNDRIGEGNSFDDNYVSSVYISATDGFIDKDYYEVELPEGIKENYGAFAGDSPYVLSGIPAAPVIQDLVMPTTVEKGKKMNVTIKVGVQK